MAVACYLTPTLREARRLGFPTGGHVRLLKGAGLTLWELVSSRRLGSPDRVPSPTQRCLLPPSPKSTVGSHQVRSACAHVPGAALCTQIGPVENTQRRGHNGQIVAFSFFTCHCCSERRFLKGRKQPPALRSHVHPGPGEGRGKRRPHSRRGGVRRPGRTGWRTFPGRCARSAHVDRAPAPSTPPRPPRRPARQPARSCRCYN